MKVYGAARWLVLISLFVIPAFVLAARDYTRDMNEVRLAMMSYACPKAGKCSPPNTFMGVIGELEKSVFVAKSQRYRPTIDRIKRIKRYIALASKYKSKRFTLDSIGSGMYTSMKVSPSTPVGKRSFLTGAKKFLEAVKKELGGKVFDKVISVKGDVTLIFVIDDTGSMGPFITAAKGLATAIINTKRDFDVDYILSTFNDPPPGKVTRMESDQKDQFVKEIGKLHANGGGDCPEFAFKGMLDAIAAGPNLGSPMYVFTDATAKDYNKKRMEELLDEAYPNEININFFVKNSPCGQKSYKPYEDLAAQTCGQMIYLPSSSYLTHLTGLATKSLVGKTCLQTGGLGYGPGKRRKRAAGDSVYYIIVDDITDAVMITVRAASDISGVTLAAPSGAVVSHPSVRISVGNGVIYDISNPPPGKWKLTVGASAGSHSYEVQGSSKSNVGFSYFFIMVPTVGRNREPIAVPYPLKGVKAMAIVTLTGVDKIQTSSLSLTLTDKNGIKIRDADSFTAQGASGVHFLATMSPPPGPFKLVLKGKTKGGYPFKRNSRTVIEAKSAVLTLLYTKHDQTIPAGGTSYAFLILHNYGKTEQFTINATDNLGVVYSVSRPRTVRSKGARTMVVRVRAGVGDKGKSATVFIRATGGTSKVVAGYVLNMLVA